MLDTNTHEIYNRHGYCYRGIYLIASFPSHNCIVNARPKINKEAPYISIFQANVHIPKGNYLITSFLNQHAMDRPKKGVSLRVKTI